MTTLFHHDFRLTADETDFNCEMPLSSLVALIINTATGHANEIGAGFDRLHEFGASWVLSRLAIDLLEPVRQGVGYRLDTWVLDLNRIYSTRLFELIDTDSGRTVGWVHSVWMAINVETRRPVDLTAIVGALAEAADPSHPFGGSPSGRLVRFDAEPAAEYTRSVRVSEIDVNSHLTTRCYIDRLVDLYPLEKYRRERIARFEVAFKHEITYGRPVTASEREGAAQITVEGEVCALASFGFAARES